MAKCNETVRDINGFLGLTFFVIRLSSKFGMQKRRGLQKHWPCNLFTGQGVAKHQIAQAPNRPLLGGSLAIHLQFETLHGPLTPRKDRSSQVGG